MNDGFRLLRVHGPLRHDTFSIPAVATLLDEYVPWNGRGWADPFARNSRRAYWSNDFDPATRARHHLDAQVFVRRILPPRLDGALFDPPYSYRQITEHYRAVGRSATALDTSSNFYVRVRVPLLRKIRRDGLFIHFGWNTTGPGDGARWDLIDGLDIAHGSHHNDTLVTVWRRVR